MLGSGVPHATTPNNNRYRINATVPDREAEIRKQPSVPIGGRRRPRWTREAIISELVTWLLSGTAIDAQFMTRHGPRGLATAARRIFGRFDAALNHAALPQREAVPGGAAGARCESRRIGASRHCGEPAQARMNALRDDVASLVGITRADATAACGKARRYTVDCGDMVYTIHD